MRNRCGYRCFGSDNDSESLTHVSLDSDVVGMPYLAAMRVSSDERGEHKCSTRGVHLRLRMETVAEIWRFASWFMTLLHSLLFFFSFQSESRCSAPFSL